MPGLMDRLAQRLGYSKAGAFAPPGWLSSQADSERYSLIYDDSRYAQQQMYRKLSWVQTAISQVAQTGASAALNVKRRQGEGTEDVPNHPLELLLQRPNPMQSRFELLVSTLSFQAMGNAFWYLTRTSENAPPSEIWVMPANKVSVVPDGKMFLRGYLYDSGIGSKIPLEPWQVVHFKRFNPDSPYEGLDPLEALSDIATGDLAMQRWNKNYFHRDHAKVPGALAFADIIDDDTWKQMKSDISREHGGTDRRMMLLRNAGKGGVQWVSMGVSQRDMEFLAGRTFNREEIFSVFAPGLASMLAVNATEANAIAGRRTFIEMAVWPALTMIAEKITNDLLPSYGEGLVAEFEDIRPTDRQMAIAEQASAEKVQTIDELRAAFYDLKPIGDERGKLLPAEVTHGLTIAPEPAPTLTLKNGPLGGDLQEGSSNTLDNALDKRSEVENGRDGGLDEAALPDDAVKAAERKALRNWLRKRPDSDPASFKARALDIDEVEEVVFEMRRGGGDGQPPFGQGNTRKAPAPSFEAVDRKRRRLENKHAEALATALHRLRLRAVPPGSKPETLTPFAIEQRLRDNRDLLRDALYQMLHEAAMLGVTVGQGQVDDLRGGVKVAVEVTSWDLPNAQVGTWLTGTGVTGYADQLTDQVMAHTVTTAAPMVAEWTRNGQPLSTLVSNLEESGFSATRAERIARTEVTRAYARGNREAWRASGFIDGRTWHTAFDEAVCAICGGLNGETRGLDEPFTSEIDDPPAHVNCRCTTGPFVGATQRIEATAHPKYVEENEPAPLSTPRMGTPDLPWKPSMARAEAEEWAAKSVWQHPMYHTTISGRGAGIAEEGFDLGRRQFGRVMGDGVYLTDTKRTVEQYRNWVVRQRESGQLPETLEFRVNMRNVVEVEYKELTGYQGNHLLYVAEKAHPGAAEEIRIVAEALRNSGNYQGDALQSAFATKMQEWGYDGFRFYSNQASAALEGMGGDQIIVFDPRRVVVVKESIGAEYVP